MVSKVACARIARGNDTTRALLRHSHMPSGRGGESMAWLWRRRALCLRRAGAACPCDVARQGLKSAREAGIH
eukprot:10225457-Alexandrium_andersonii.AAC.1